MALQEGVIKFKGRIGDLSFYKSKDGYQARQKGGVDANRIATDPRFQRTRENGTEFGRAGKDVKLFRKACSPLIIKGADRTLTNRLMSGMVQVVKADAVNRRGERLVLPENLPLLSGFELNGLSMLESRLTAAYVVAADAATGVVTVDLPVINPDEEMHWPQGADHFQVQATAVVINFDTGDYALNQEKSVVMPLNVPTAALTLTCSVAPLAGQAVMVILGIDFYQQVNAVDYLMSNGIFNAQAIVQVVV